MSSAKLEVYTGIDASVNAYLLYDNDSAVLIDALRNSKEAKGLANFIKAKGRPLTTILITHGHPDHYIGLGVLKEEFPETRIVVAAQEIKDDIIGFSTWMESVGWLDGEPALKPKCNAHPKGFDYEKNIEVLKQKELSLADGTILEVKCDYPPTECEHLTTVYVRELNVLLLGDFFYNGVHLWAGQGVTKEHLKNWKNELDAFQSRYSASNPTVFAGHGEQSGIRALDAVKKYIDDFLETTRIVKTRTEAIQRMKSLYPSYKEADFLLVHSVEFHVHE